ncbi:AP2-like ethylene-responsive transcription factor TOE2 [Zea mays]|uniref:AP2-like ethylene-responsive transcription factor TOE2 n=1 Tax=Zea mays TaxID=4577 RepID=A0A1D6LYF0_MAIZE|nr:AP2-like ethylene-responsive transcription factor TOE2 [Zea mays]
MAPNLLQNDMVMQFGLLGFAMTECDWLHAPHSISRSVNKKGYLFYLVIRWLRHRRQDNEGLRSGCSKILGPATHVNFPVENYRDELEEMKGMTRQEFVAHLRRHHQQGRWQSRIGRVAGNKDLYLDTFSKKDRSIWL